MNNKILAAILILSLLMCGCVNDGVSKNKTLVESQTKSYNNININSVADAYFKTAICGTPTVESMLASAPEEVWNTLPTIAEGGTLEDKCTSYYYMFLEYVRPYFTNDFGVDYEITYNIEFFKEQEKKDFEDFKSWVYQSEVIDTEPGGHMNIATGEGVYTTYVMNYLKDYPIEKTYDVKIKYTISGNGHEKAITGDYILVEYCGKWFLTHDLKFDVFWDRTLTEQLDDSWIPGNS